MVGVLARFRVKPEEIGQALVAIQFFIQAIHVNEPGTLAYDACRHVDDPTLFIHTMTSRDLAAREFYVDTPHVERFVAKLYPRCEVEPEFTSVELVGSSSMVGSDSGRGR